MTEKTPYTKRKKLLFDAYKYKRRCRNDGSSSMTNKGEIPDAAICSWLQTTDGVILKRTQLVAGDPQTPGWKPEYAPYLLNQAVSALPLKGCYKKQENFQSITNPNNLEPKNLITMKTSQYDFVFFVFFVYFVVK